MSTEKGYYAKYSLNELKEKDINYEVSHRRTQPLEDQVDTDKLKGKAWTSAYSQAAYYLDNPTKERRLNALDKFRFNFHGLLSQTKTPNELPDLRSRESFVLWVCKKHNEFLENKESDFRVDCDATRLIGQYGPNYNKIKSFLGEHDYYL
jgi:hypothetical protein